MWDKGDESGPDMRPMFCITLLTSGRLVFDSQYTFGTDSHSAPASIKVWTVDGNQINSAILTKKPLSEHVKRGCLRVSGEVCIGSIISYLDANVEISDLNMPKGVRPS